MATWFEITYTGVPTEADWARVAELAAQGFTSGQLNGGEDEDGHVCQDPAYGPCPRPECGQAWR